jgi:hypothetical protein
VYGSHLDSCPPKSAKAEEGSYFRLIKDGSLDTKNFLSHAELHPNNKLFAASCNHHSLSLVPDLKSAQDLVSKHPKAFSTHGLAKINIKKNHGRLFKDNPGHVSWWRDLSLTPTDIAQIAEIEIPNSEYDTIAELLGETHDE